MCVIRFQEVELHPKSPTKPVFGTPCNGCGVCCAASPCPVAIVFLFQLRGKCRALLWQDERYVCGMVVRPDRYVWLLPERWRNVSGRFFASRIAAGAGCDSFAEIVDDMENGPDAD
jgi:hypothetical protein